MSIQGAKKNKEQGKALRTTCNHAHSRRPTRGKPLRSLPGSYFLPAPMHHMPDKIDPPHLFRRINLIGIFGFIRIVR